MNINNMLNQALLPDCGIKLLVPEDEHSPTGAPKLDALSCDEAQGYLYAKPLPPKDIEAMLIKA